MNARWQDTPAAVFMRLLADLMFVNILAIICAMPLISIGASLSAMYAVLFDRERNEGTVAVLTTFFRTFLRNFPKATVLQLIVMVVFGVAAGDLWYAGQAPQPSQALFQTVGTIVLLIGLTLFVLAFAQQSIYQNSISGYLKNSIKLAACAPWQLLLCLAAWIGPWFLGFMDEEMLKYMGFFLMLWGFAFPAWVTAKLMSKVFAKAGQEPQSGKSKESEE